MAPFQLDLIEDKVGSISGIELLRVTPNYVKVKYYPHLHDESELIEVLSLIGLKPKQIENEGFFRRFLNKMINENKKSFGSQKLDCCDLN